MAVNKVVINGETKIDLTSDTVTADTLLSGVTAHDKSGASITGTMPTVTSTTASATPTFSSQTITPPTGYDYLSQVTVAAIPVAYTQNPSGGQTCTVG